MTTKPILIIFEGADASGKTSTARELCKNDPFRLIDLPKKTIFLDATKKRQKMVIDDPQSLTLFLKILEVLPKVDGEVWVMDRSIHSNLIYGCKDIQLTYDAISQMNNIFDIRLYLLDRDFVAVDFEDDNLAMKKDRFNGVIQAYRDYGKSDWLSGEKIFRTRLVYDGVFDNLKQEQLINSIMLSI